MASNLLSMPLVMMQVRTGTNEDWVDSLQYVVNSGEDVPVETMPQLDLTGIRFDMEVRRRAGDSEVVIRASSAEDSIDGGLAIGDAPNLGFLLINVLHDKMKQLVAGTYVADIVGRDEVYTRRVAMIDLSIDEGITRP